MRTGLAAAAILLDLTAVASAQVPQAFPPPAVPLELRAIRADAPPAIDGRLDEPVWTRAPLASAFVQAEPRQGDPATEATEVRVVFDADFLYVGVVCHDSTGDTELRVRDLRRDFDDTTDDFFGIAIDGVQDGRSAVVFRVNPRGALRDQQTVDGGLADVDFDAVWTARTSRDARGWSAELAIPWATLRYREGHGTWNVNFHRMHRRKNESSGWSPWPRVMQPFRMDYAGHLTGLEPPPPGRNLRLQPYVVGEATRADTAGGRIERDTAEVGTDLKWAITPNTVLDLTVNPDFGQTDVDRQVVNLTRFSVFFPERRQFFLENRGVFFSGNGGRFEPFFSRRIGLDGAGEPLPIRAGARVTMRSAGHAFGALAASQGGAGTESEFGVVRYVKNFAGQNRLGGIVAVRNDRGGDSNVVAGVDGFWRMSSTAFIRGTVTQSATSGEGGEGVGGYVWIANDTNRGYFGYISELVTRGYDARSGFVVRNDYIRISPAVTLDWRPSWRPRFVRRIQPGFTLEHFIDPKGGAVQEGFLSLRPFTLQFENGGTLQYSALPNWQRLRTPFRPVPGVAVPPGSYDYLRHAITLQTDPSTRVAFRFEGQVGGYFDGTLETWRGVLQATPDPRVAVSADYTINRLDGVGGLRSALTTHLLGLETRLATTPRLQLVSFVQWNTVARQFTANARLAWEYRPLSFFTIVYNDRSPVDGRGVMTPAPFTSRQLLVKLTWLRQL
ncbi:MAG: carbohydrate binding family 9 domain-containing protein [Acidobacteria bacterium]|nr:carbohydrate binding family 9 domain-containing protein [Acidobacteriota bacterium]